MVTKEMREARAKQDLERYRDLMIMLWGEKYTTRPQYAAAVHEVAHKARYPKFVLMDAQGL